jgi:hypothetical protein
VRASTPSSGCSPGCVRLPRPARPDRPGPARPGDQRPKSIGGCSSRCGYVQWRATSRRCDGRTLAGVTSRRIFNVYGRSLISTASTARSVQFGHDLSSAGAGSRSHGAVRGSPCPWSRPSGQGNHSAMRNMTAQPGGDGTGTFPIPTGHDRSGPHHPVRRRVPGSGQLMIFRSSSASAGGWAYSSLGMTGRPPTHIPPAEAIYTRKAERSTGRHGATGAGGRFTRLPPRSATAEQSPGPGESAGTLWIYVAQVEAR